MSSVHILSSGVPFNHLSNCMRHHVFAFSVPCLPKTAQQWYHQSGKDMKVAEINSKPERPRFDDIQVEGADGQSVSRMKRFQAEQIAKDRGLKLVLVSAACDSQSVPRYRLLTNLEYRTQMKEAKQVKRMNKSPEVKTLKLNANIAEHDLRIKVSHVVEWLQGGHSVKIAILTTSGSRKSSQGMGDDAVFNNIVSASKEIATVKQAKKTASQMLFHLVPKADGLSSVLSSTSESTDATSTGDDKNQKPLKLLELKQLRDKVEIKSE